MFYYWDTINIGNLSIFTSEDLKTGVENLLKSPLTIIDGEIQMTTPGYYGIYNEEVLYIYKVEPGYYFWNANNITNIGIAGTPKTNMELYIDKSQWGFVEELTTVLNKGDSLVFKPSDVKGMGV